MLVTVGKFSTYISGDLPASMLQYSYLVTTLSRMVTAVMASSRLL